jgi:hypothetical protein
MGLSLIYTILCLQWSRHGPRRKHRFQDLSSNGPGIVDAGAHFGYRANVFNGSYVMMDGFSGPAIPAFSRHVTIFIQHLHVMPPCTARVFTQLRGNWMQHLVTGPGTCSYPQQVAVGLPKVAMK